MRKREAKTKLSAMRQASGLSQREFSELTGIRWRTLQHYEQGRKPFDSARIEKLLKTCIALKCTLPDVLENQEYIDLYNQYMMEDET